MDITQKIEQMISEHPVMVFMKGTPERPQCGFSARVIEILNFLKVKYHYFNVLEDPEMRNQIKEYSKWPTIPQVYINKEFIGGCDIVQEQFSRGELEKLLSQT